MKPNNADTESSIDATMNEVDRQRFEAAVIEELYRRHGVEFALVAEAWIEDDAGRTPVDVARGEGVPPMPAYADVVASAYRRMGEGPAADEVAAYRNALARRGAA